MYGQPMVRIKFNVTIATRKRTPDLAVKPRKLSGVRRVVILVPVLAGNQGMIRRRFQSASRRARVPASPSSYCGGSVCARSLRPEALQRYARNPRQTRTPPWAKFSDPAFGDRLEHDTKLAAWNLTPDIRTVPENRDSRNRDRNALSPLSQGP